MISVYRGVRRFLKIWNLPACETLSSPVRVRSGWQNRFSGYFDCVLVDAPCSGEGMFRKEPSMAADWSPEEVARYSGLQKEILAQAASMVRRAVILCIPPAPTLRKKMSRWWRRCWHGRTAPLSQRDRAAKNRWLHRQKAAFIWNPYRCIPVWISGTRNGA